MRNMEMKLNDKGIVAVCLVVIVLTLSLGAVCGFGLRSKTISSDAQQFTAEQAQLIIDMQAKEDEAGSGQLVYGKFDENGKFWVCWDMTDDHWAAQMDGLAALQN